MSKIKNIENHIQLRLVKCCGAAYSLSKEQISQIYLVTSFYKNYFECNFCYSNNDHLRFGKHQCYRCRKKKYGIYWLNFEENFFVCRKCYNSKILYFSNKNRKIVTKK